MRSCNFYEIGAYETVSDDLSIKDFSTKEEVLALVEDKELYQYVWNKLYKVGLIDNVLFPVGECHENEFWTYQVF